MERKHRVTAWFVLAALMITTAPTFSIILAGTRLAEAAAPPAFVGTLASSPDAFGGVVISPDSQTAYLTVPSENEVAVLDLATETYETPIDVGSDPQGLDISPDGKTLYVCDTGGETISVVTLSNDTVSTVTTPDTFLGSTPWQIVVGDNDTALFTTTFDGSGYGAATYLLNLESDAVSEESGLSLVTEDTRLARSADYSTAVISLGDVSDGPVWIYNFDTGAIVTTGLNTSVGYSAASGNAGTVLVNSYDDTYVLDGKTATLLATMPGGGSGVAVDQDGMNGFSLGSAALEEFNLTRFDSEGSIALPGGAAGTGQLVLSPDGTTLVGVVSMGAVVFHQAVPTAPQFTSAASTTVLLQSTLKFSVTASGIPTPSLTEAGPLPQGVTFTDNGNGTATLSGYLGNDAAATYPITFTATNTTASVEQSFTLSIEGPPPSITGITPSADSPGAFVLISGTNLGQQPLQFGSTPSGSSGSSCLFLWLCTQGVTVNFGTVPASVVFDSDTEVGVVAPDGQGTVDVTVTVGGATSSITPDDHFTFSSSAPVISTLTPNTGSDYQFVKVEGTNLLPSGGPSICSWVTCGSYITTDFGSAPALVFWATPTWMLVLVPPGSGTVPIAVSVDGITSASVPADLFTYDTNGT